MAEPVPSRKFLRSHRRYEKSQTLSSQSFPRSARNLHEFVGSGKEGTVDATTRLFCCGFLRVVERCERAVCSAAVRERYRKLVRHALPWATVSERRDLRSGEADRRAPDPAIWHKRAGAP